MLTGLRTIFEIHTASWSDFLCLEGCLAFCNQTRYDNKTNMPKSRAETTDHIHNLEYWYKRNFFFDKNSTFKMQLYIYSSPYDYKITISIWIIVFFFPEWSAFDLMLLASSKFEKRFLYRFLHVPMKCSREY